MWFFFSFNSFPASLQSSTPLVCSLSFSRSLLRDFTHHVCLLKHAFFFFPEKCENSRRKFLSSVQHGIRVSKLILEVQVVWLPALWVLVPYDRQGPDHDSCNESPWLSLQSNPWPKSNPLHFLQPCCFLLRCCLQAEGKTRPSVGAYCSAPGSLMGTGWDPTRCMAVGLLYDEQTVFWMPGDCIQRAR